MPIGPFRRPELLMNAKKGPWPLADCYTVLVRQDTWHKSVAKCRLAHRDGNAPACAGSADCLESSKLATQSDPPIIYRFLPARRCNDATRHKHATPMFLLFRKLSVRLRCCIISAGRTKQWILTNFHRNIAPMRPQNQL